MSKLFSLRLMRVSSLIFALSSLVISPSLVQAKTAADVMAEISANVKGGKLDLGKSAVFSKGLAGAGELLSSPLTSAEVIDGVLTGKVMVQGKAATFLAWPADYEALIKDRTVPSFYTLILANGALPLDALAQPSVLGADLLGGLSLADPLLAIWKGADVTFTVGDAPDLVKAALTPLGLSDEDEILFRDGINLYTKLKIAKSSSLNSLLSSLNVDNSDRTLNGWVDLRGLGSFIKGKKPSGDKIAFELSAGLGAFSPANWFKTPNSDLVIATEGGEEGIIVSVVGESELKINTFKGTKSVMLATKVSRNFTNKETIIRAEFDQDDKKSTLGKLLGLPFLKTKDTAFQISMPAGGPKVVAIEGAVTVGTTDFPIDMEFPLVKSGIKIPGLGLKIPDMSVDALLDKLGDLSPRKPNLKEIKSAAKMVAGTLKGISAFISPEKTSISARAGDVNFNILTFKNGGTVNAYVFVDIAKTIVMNDIVPAGVPGRNLVQGISFDPPLLAFGPAAKTMNLAEDLPKSLQDKLMSYVGAGEELEDIYVGPGITLFSGASLSNSPGVSQINDIVTLEMPKRSLVSGSIGGGLAQLMSTSVSGSGDRGFSFLIPVKTFSPIPRKLSSALKKNPLTVKNPRLKMALSTPKGGSLSDLSISFGIVGESEMDLQAKQMVKSEFEFGLDIAPGAVGLKIEMVAENKNDAGKVKKIQEVFGLKWLDLTNFTIGGEIGPDGIDFLFRGAAKVGRKFYDLTASVGAGGVPKVLRFVADEWTMTDLLTLGQLIVLDGKEVVDFDKVPQFKLLPMRWPSTELKAQLIEADTLDKVVLSFVAPGEGDAEKGLQEGVIIQGNLHMFGLNIADMYGQFTADGLKMEGKTNSGGIDFAGLAMRESTVDVDVPFDMRNMPRVKIAGKGPALLGSSADLDLIFEYDEKEKGIVASSIVDAKLFGDSFKSYNELRAVLAKKISNSKFNFTGKVSQEFTRHLREGATAAINDGFGALDSEYKDHQKTLDAALKDVENLTKVVATVRVSAQKNKADAEAPLRAAQGRVNKLKRDINHAKKQASKYKKRYKKCHWTNLECQVKNSAQTNYWKSKQRVFQGSYWTAWGVLEGVKKTVGFIPIDAYPEVAAAIGALEISRGTLRVAKVAVAGLADANKWVGQALEDTVNGVAGGLFELKGVTVEGKLEEILKGGDALVVTLKTTVLGKSKTSTLYVNPNKIGKVLETTILNAVTSLAKGSVHEAKSIRVAAADSKIPKLVPAGTKWQWEKIKGAALDIGVGGDGSVWVVGTNNKLYKFNFKKNTWDTFKGGGYGQRISVDEKGNPWVIGGRSNDKKGHVRFIYRWNGKKWINTKIKGIDLDIGNDGTVWALGDAKGKDTIRRWNAKTKKWTVIKGKATRIAVDPKGKAWVVNRAGNIYEYIGGSKVWKRLDGRAIDIGIGGDGRVWVIGTNNKIYYRANNIWNLIGGKAAQIAVDAEGLPWVVNRGRQIYVNHGSEEKPTLTAVQIKEMRKSLGITDTKDSIIKAAVKKKTIR